MTDQVAVRMRLPLWVWAVSAFGVAWNLFGLAQLADFVQQTRASLMMNGMSPVAADLYYALPTWMKLAFAIGSLGGLVGSVALLVGRRAAIPIFAASLVGYVALYAGDAAYGVFAVLPDQMAVLSVVVGIAVALPGAALLARRKGLIR